MTGKPARKSPKSTGSRSPYPPGFRQQALRLAARIGVADAAEQLDFARGLAYSWQALASHHPLRSFGRHARLVDDAGNPGPDAAENTGDKEEDEEGNAEEFADQTRAVATSAKVELVLSGHDHDQQVIAHSGEPVQIVTGGGGKPPYAVTHRGPDLKYSASEHGFVKIEVGPDALEIDMMNSDGAVKARSREERRYIPALQVCLHGPG